MEQLFVNLERLRRASHPEQWNELVLRCRRHPLRALVHQDPFTWRAYEKPRGYAGDAEMMDYIYSWEELWPPPPSSQLGQWLFQYTTNAPASQGVRARRGFIAHVLDQVAESQRLPHVLAIASGHLREAQLTSGIRRRRFGRFVALDGDSRSLDEVQRCYGPFGVETLVMRIARLLSPRIQLGSFDVIYSLGLYDYLDAPLGQRLTARLFDMLRTGGRLIVANFLPEIRDVGYMEAYMDWRLIYRTRHEMLDLTRDIPQAELQELCLHAEENQNIIFLELRRR